jgi:hypothetical protein
MIMKIAYLLILSLVVSSCSFVNIYQAKQSKKNAEFDQFDFDDLAKLYMKKSTSTDNSIEGIYSVSHLIVKKGKSFLSSVEKEKVVDRKENYGTVVIFSDNRKSTRDYFEVPLSSNRQLSYSIRGEFSRASEGSILIYKHFEPKKKVLTYTFTYDESKDLLEGVRTENDGKSVITYTLTYIKLFPKAENSVQAEK